ncbi:ribokinase [Aquibacillus halophilus]|uniref:Ribokinase n=1 Tax=Aquibacillus halophilus TaxID=930132 RepID=A0A6A8DTS3_9BACI|nr:ribokinase [Aquibacillus halophilus]MRH44622.1 ribokinase [Aquibacillus halophilus]
MSKKIVVIGSLNMDIIVAANKAPRLGETIHGEKVEYLPGGKGANQAVAIKKLGGEIDMIGVIGDDLFGKKILKQFSEFGLATNNIIEKENESTGIANIVHLPTDNSIIVIPGANGHCTPEVIKDRESIISEADILLVQLEIPIETVEFALSIAKRHGAQTILNPAPAKKLSRDLLRLVDYITPNQTELQSLLGSDLNIENNLSSAFQQWESMHDSKLIVTLGDKGCAYSQDGSVKVIPAGNQDKIVDTTGAGDCFNGALAFGLAEEWSLQKALLFAVKAAGISISKMGAQEGMPYYHEIHQD